MLTIRRSCCWTAVIALLAAAAGACAVSTDLSRAYAVRVAATAGSASAVECVLLSPTSGSSPSGPTTVVTVGEAYECLLRHYGGIAVLRPELLLRAAMAGVVGYMKRHGEDSRAAALPALSSDPGAAWRSFERAFTQAIDGIPAGSRQLSGLVSAAILSMAASLHDDHTQYTPAGHVPLGAQQPDLGMYVRTLGPALRTPRAMLVDDLDPAGPAAAAGLRPGDLVERVDGHSVSLPPASDLGSPAVDEAARLWTPAQLGWIPAHTHWVNLLVRRPANGRQFSLKVAVARSMFNISSRTLPGHVAYVRIHGFFTPSTGREAIDALRRRHPRHGVIIDLRGNTGGNPQALAGLIGGFVHHKLLAVNIDRRTGRRHALQSDDSVALLQQPLVMLIDGGSLSAAEIAAADVRDLRLGSLVGERTAGVVAGAGLPFALDDGSVLAIDTAAAYGPNREIIDDIGVPADQAAPLPTPRQLGRGQDPGITTALRKLTFEHTRRR
jgi:carboxyl-terminal processing protease